MEYYNGLNKIIVKLTKKCTKLKKSNEKKICIDLPNNKPTLIHFISIFL